MYRLTSLRPWPWARLALLTLGTVTVAACTGQVVVPTSPATTSTVATTTTSTLPPVVGGPGVEEGSIRLAAAVRPSPAGTSLVAGQQVYWEYVDQTLGGVGGRFAVELVETAVSDPVLDDVALVAASLTPDETLAVARRAPEGMLVVAGVRLSGWPSSPGRVVAPPVPDLAAEIEAGLGWALGEGASSAALATAGAVSGACEAGFRRSLERLDLSEAEPSSAAVTVACGSSAAVPADAAGLLVVGQAAYRAEGATADLVVGSIPMLESGDPGMKLLRDNQARFGTGSPAEGVWFFVGYLQAAAVHELLEEAVAGLDLSTAGLEAALERLDEADFGFGDGPVAPLDSGPGRDPAPRLGIPGGDGTWGLDRVGE